MVGSTRLIPGSAPMACAPNHLTVGHVFFSLLHAGVRATICKPTPYIYTRRPKCIIYSTLIRTQLYRT